MVATCDSEGCRPPGAGQSEAVTSGSSTTGGGGAPDTVDLSGDLWLFQDDTFSFERVEPYLEPATLYGVDADNRVLAFSYDGNAFLVSGIASSPSTMLLVDPTQVDGVALPTLLALDTLESRELSLPLVRVDVLDEIFSSLTSQVVVDEARAQLVLQFLDASDRPLSGVSVASSEAEFVAYASGGGYSDLLDETSERGLVVLGNLPAAEFPGSLLNVRLSGAAVGQQVLMVVSGAVTYQVFSAD